MIVVLTMAAVIWIIGAVQGAPMQARWIMIGLLMVGVLFIQFALPAGHPLREATGSSPQLWLLILAFIAIGWGYGKVLSRVRASAQAKQEVEDAPKTAAAQAEAELTRNARHIVLREIGGPGQRALKEAKVLVIGAGGLGSPALQYLGGAGVGTIGIIDDDVVEVSNLARQVIHADADQGRPKVFSAADSLTAQNPHITVRPYNRRLTADIAAELFADYDLILEGSDNFDTRYLANAAAVATGKPMIGAALTQWEGQIALYHPAAGGPCYRCLFPEPPDPALAPSCAEAGVLAPLPGVIGSMMAVEAVKYITGAGDPLLGRMLIYDALYAEVRIIEVARRPDCPDCSHVVAAAG